MMLRLVLRRARPLCRNIRLPLRQTSLSGQRWLWDLWLPPSSRDYATPPPQLNVSSLTTEQYNRLADDAMDNLLESLEDLVDNHGEEGFEVEYSSSVLTLRLGSHGTYVINKQPPNKQIWLSSPLSGPKRYDYSTEKTGWYYIRDGKRLDALLKEELGVVFDREVNVRLD